METNWWLASWLDDLLWSNKAPILNLSFLGSLLTTILGVGRLVAEAMWRVGCGGYVVGVGVGVVIIRYNANLSSNWTELVLNLN